MTLIRPIDVRAALPTLALLAVLGCTAAPETERPNSAESTESARQAPPSIVIDVGEPPLMRWK